MSRADLAHALAHAASDVTRHYLRLGDRDWSERHAVDLRLRAALADADAHRRAVEKGIWRDYHGSACSSASRLAIAIFAHEGHDLDEAVGALGPGGDEVDWLVGRAFGRSTRRAKGRSGGLARDARAADDRDRFLHSGYVVRPWREGRRPLGVRMSKHDLEVGFGLGEVFVRTVGDEAVLFIEAAVPETVKAALPGRRVRDLVDHPVLRDPALVVMGVDVEAAPSSFGPDAFTLTIRAPRVPWRVPWARDGA